MFSGKKSTAIFFITTLILILLPYLNIKAANIGSGVNFYIDKRFEANERSEVSATLVKETGSIYFYIEKPWWDTQVQAKKNEILAYLDGLSLEFNSKIYPTLTSVFGQEWKPGVDGDNKITVLLHSMKEGIGGYFRSSDEYIKLQIPDSNEREMIYLSVSEIESSKLKIFLSHEFLHLITFNYKDRINNVQEEIWLNEARADYVSAVLGYDNPYDGSNLSRRVRDFLENPSDSLTEWQETKYDYGVASLFGRYLVDHYGINILSDSLKSKLVGIASINEALIKNGYQEVFSQIFTDWTITTVINDCLISMKYCYLNHNLKNLRINPTLNFLPLVGNSSLSVTNVTKNWSGNWQKIIGGNGDLRLEFEGLQSLNFQVPYIIFNKDNNYSVNFMNINESQRGEINIKNFGNKYNSLTIIPSLQTKNSGFDGFEFTYPYTFTVSVTGGTSTGDQTVIQKLLSQIESLKKQIADLQTSKVGGGCLKITENLYSGVVNKSQVICLQNFLKSQGSETYPEGLVTGFFGNLTKSAVIRFQTKYWIPSTGFVGVLTRAKINQLLSGGQ